MTTIEKASETEKILSCVERMLDSTYKSPEHKKLDILNYLKRTLQAERQKRDEVVEAKAIEVREEEANEYNKIIEREVEAERERIKSLFPKLNPNSDSWGTTKMESILKSIDTQP